MPLSKCFKVLYSLICNVVILSYYVWNVIGFVSCYLLTVIIRLQEF